MRLLLIMTLLAFILPVTGRSMKDQARLILPDQQSCLRIPGAISTADDCADCDRFKVASTCPIAYYSIEIFDRRGERVFESTDITRYWDGSQGAAYLPVGCYFYHILYQRLYDGPVEEYNGTVVYLH